MNDPWDVKSVRQSGQYISCMKINGTPLLPPVLSQECRNEMKYYKLLAKEVERRIEQLKPYSEENESDSIFDEHDAYNNKFDKTNNAGDLHADFDLKIEKVKPIHLENDLVPTTSNSNYIQSNDITPKNLETPHRAPSPKFVIDLSVSINENSHKISKSPFPQIELPERDTNSSRRPYQINRSISPNNDEKGNLVEVNFNSCFNQNVLLNRTDPTHCRNLSIRQDGPSSLSSKSFTGSLNNIYSECVNEDQNSPRLVRQRSYTLLEPSPQLIAHLEVESLNSGIEMTSISMSESISNLNSPMKKRRSWDLESAKVKWSSMALELDQRKTQNLKHSQHQGRSTTRSPVGRNSSARARSVAYCRKVGIGTQRPASAKPDCTTEKVSSKTDSSSSSFQASILLDSPEELPLQTDNTERTSQIKDTETTQVIPTSKLDCDADPATRVRELYERIQKQQLMQMATLVEKQKREQCLLQQVFEQQNNVLYKQLKTICPKQPIEAKTAWTEKPQADVTRGPVSLSQLIEKDSDDMNTSVDSTLTDTGHYISHCEDVLKKSRDISNHFRKPPATDKAKTPTTPSVPKNSSVTSKRRSSSPNPRTQTPIKINGNTRECDDAMLTDRTNDTMADLNFTLTTDDSACDPYVSNETCIVNDNVCTTKSMSNNAASTPNCSMNRTAQNSTRGPNSTRSSRRPGKQLFENKPATHKEREAATKIVAHARGYLVRRLMGTERVQATVQTIRDALVCALQLHRDQAGIRGADVDLHRRLIQQITAACYSLHETFVASSPAERCALVAADRARKRALAARPPARRHSIRTPDIMSRSHSGAFPPRSQRSVPAPAYDMTRSDHETFSNEKWQAASRTRQVSRGEAQRRPWR